MTISLSHLRRVSGLAGLMLGVAVVTASVGVATADARGVKVRVNNDEEGPRERSDVPPPPPPSASAPPSGGPGPSRSAPTRPLTAEQQREAAENAKKHFDRARQTLADEGELDDAGNKIGSADAAKPTRTTDVSVSGAGPAPKGMACVAGC